MPPVWALLLARDIQGRVVETGNRFHQAKKPEEIKIRLEADQESKLATKLIAKFEELHSKSETAQVMKWRALIGAALQNLFIFDHSNLSSTVAMDSGFLDRLVMELARVQIKVFVEIFAIFVRNAVLNALFNRIR